MIARNMQAPLEQALARQAAVALIGPRQVGKTTLAHEVAAGRPSLYLDLENATDRAKLAEPELFLARHEDKLIILDENHHALADISPRRSFYVHGGTDRFPMTANTEAISLPALAAELAALG